MKFTRSNDDLNGQVFFRHICDEKSIEIGIYPVMFGFRIRARILDDMWYPIDYCGGAKHEEVEEIYNLVLNILKKQDTINWSVFPSWEIRPIHKDLQCISALRNLAGDIIDPVTIPDLHKIRADSFESIFNNR